MRIKIITMGILCFISLSMAQFNKAAHFYGPAGYIAVPTDSSLQMTNEITMETWVKIDNFHNSQIGFSGSWDDIHGAQRTWFLWILNSRFEFLVSGNGASFARASGFFPDDSTWYHLAGTFDGSALKLYVDDSLITTTNYTSSIHTNTLPLYIGRTETGSNGSDYLYGWLDELRIWNKARSFEQIKQTWHDTLDSRYYSSADSGLVAYYRFDSPQDLGIGADSTFDVFDHSVYANHGDIIGHVEFDTAGIVITDIGKGEPVNSIANFILQQNYPNPFNPVTMISYQLSVTNNVELSVYSIVGQKIITLVDKKQPAGKYRVQWDASGFASGVYIYKLQAGDFIQTRKMLLIR